MVLHAHGQFQAAAKCYSRAWALDPKRFDTVYCWGQALASMGEYGLAAGRFDAEDGLARVIGITQGQIVRSIGHAGGLPVIFY
jgi:hypothetical protein